MEARRELLLGFIGLLVFYLGLSFAAVALQQRLEPTVAVIEQQNLRSIEISMGLVHELSEEPSLMGVGLSCKMLEEGAGASFHWLDASVLARLNGVCAQVVELERRGNSESELRLLSEMKQSLEEYLQGSAYHPAGLVAQLVALIDINRKEMRDRGAEANRLAQGGIWVLAVLTLIGGFWTILFAQKIQRRMLRPLRRTAWALRTSERRSDDGIRIYVNDCPRELAGLADSLNQLLDLRAKENRKPLDDTQCSQGPIVEALMQYVEEPAWIVDNHGEIKMANQEGMAHQQGDSGRSLKASLRAILLGTGEGSEDFPSNAFEISPLNQSEHWLCILTRLPAEACSD